MCQYVLWYKSALIFIQLLSQPTVTVISYQLQKGTEALVEGGCTQCFIDQDKYCYGLLVILKVMGSWVVIVLLD